MAKENQETNYAYALVKTWPDDDDGKVDVIAICKTPDMVWQLMTEDLAREREDAEFNDEDPSYDLNESSAYIKTEMQGTIKWQVFKKPLGLPVGA